MVRTDGCGMTARIVSECLEDVEGRCCEVRDGAGGDGGADGFAAIEAQGAGGEEGGSVYVDLIDYNSRRG